MNRKSLSVALLLVGAMLSLTLPSQRLHAGNDHLLVRVAGGAVEVQIPDDWGVWQVPYRREMRVVFAELPPRRPGRMPEDGVWLSFHARSNGSVPSFEDLDEQLIVRVREELGDTLQTSPIQQFQLAGWPAVRTDFAVTEPSLNSAGGQVASSGFYLLVGTPWGVLEYQAVAPASGYEQRVRTFEQIATTLNFREPQAARNNVADTVRDAAQIVGTWKGFRSRMLLAADGRIIIKPDVFQLAITSANEQTDQRAGWLTGQYTARGDLLFVIWDDGSRLNFRWRLTSDELLLTDHEGQLSQLRRILE